MKHFTYLSVALLLIIWGGVAYFTEHLGLSLWLFLISLVILSIQLGPPTTVKRVKKEK